MRSDMAKVVTESPRVGHDSPSAKTGGRIWGKDAPRWDDEDYDSGRTWRKVSRLGGCMDRIGSGDCHKSFSDLLGPLRGYLRKQVGRPWDDVYSELSRTLDRRSLTGIHIWGHVASEVSLNCYVARNGEVYQYGMGLRSGTPLRVYGLYVHPLTHALCNADRDDRHYTYRSRLRRRRPEPVVQVQIDGKHHRLEKIKGLWFECWYIEAVSFWMEKRHGEPAILHKEDERLVRKRQLSRKELRDNGLKNGA